MRRLLQSCLPIAVTLATFGLGASPAEAANLVDDGYRFYSDGEYITSCQFRLNKAGREGNSTEWVGRAYCTDGETLDVRIISINHNGNYRETVLIEPDGRPFDMLFQGNKENGYHLIEVVPDGTYTSDTNYDAYIYDDT